MSETIWFIVKLQFDGEIKFYFLTFCYLFILITFATQI
jgi:hypothetical protein